jgi:dTDP-4-dehydrorhamnose reductase
MGHVNVPLKILLTGSNGLLGQKIVYGLAGNPSVELLATARGPNRIKKTQVYQYMTMDIEDGRQVAAVFDHFKPHTVIHTAAMTNVDACELNPDACLRTNVEATARLIEAARHYNTHFIFLSTDFVFDGTSGPYREEDIPNPLSVYACSKWEGEKLVMNSGLPWCIIRTIILYGVSDDVQRSNVVLWVKNSLEQHQPIRVVTDQYRSPTLAEDLAQACIRAAMKKATGIYHVSGKEIMSIFEIACQVADFFGLDKSLIRPVTSDELKQPARRPLKTGFIIDKARRELDYHPHSFLEGLQLVASQLSVKKVRA